VAPEPFEITEARDRLIDRLVALTRIAPTDPWIVGESVQYLVEAGYDSSAIIEARRCKSAPWWCAALRGYVLHDLQRYADADAAFDTALAGMPETQRCAWTDLSLLIADDDRDEYARLSCEQRAPYAKRFWELADPSYAIPGNDRRTEHYARLIAITLARDAENVYGLSWGNDLQELMLRYGVPIGFTTTWPEALSTWRPVIGHDREPSYQFGALHATHDDAHWSLRAERARERYAPRYLRGLDDFPAQFAMFKRGDSALVIATYADTGSPTSRTLLGITDDLGLTVASDTGSIVRVRRSKTGWKSVVVGVERYDTATKRLERAREWLTPPQAIPGAPALSTILLYTPSDTTGVASLDAAARSALASGDLGTRRQLGLYWEMYGVQRALATTSDASHRKSRTNALADTLARDSTQPTKRDTTRRDTTQRDATRRDTTRRDTARHDVTQPDTTGDRATTPHDTLASTLSPLNAPLADTAMTVAITITRTDGGAWRWLAQRLRLTGRASPLTMGWHDLPGTPDGMAKAVVLDLSQLPAGRYHLEISAGTDPQHRTVTARDIRLR